MANEKSKLKILVFGATGYLGNYMVKASLSMGHPTYAYVRPINPNSKLHLHQQFLSSGVSIIQGDLDDHEKLVEVIRKVDVVISTLAVPQHLAQLNIIAAMKEAGNIKGELDDHEKLIEVIRKVDVVISTLAVPQHLAQLNIIAAMKEAGNIKRFVPSEYGNEVDRVTGLPPFQALLDNKKKIRRATEAAGIPYTYVSANSLAAYFVDYLLHPSEMGDEVTIYGSGEAKVVLNYEEDVAAYTVKAATDPRASNRLVIVRPSGNIITQLGLVSSWEEKSGRFLKQTHVPEEDIIKLTETLPHPDNIPVAILHNIFVKGAQMSFELTEDDLEASKLYPDYKYTSINDFLDLCLVNPPNPKLSSFT